MKNRIFEFAGLLIFAYLGFCDCGCYYRHCDQNEVYAHGDCRVSCTNNYTCIHDLEAGPSFKCNTAAGYCVKKATQGAIQDGGTTVRDGGIVNSITARVCCAAATDQVDMWWGGRTRQVTSNGAQCGTFVMTLSDFCQQGVHPRGAGGWFTANCNFGDHWRDWTSVNVQSLVDQNGARLSFTKIRGTVNRTGAAEVIVYGTCSQ